MSDRDSPAERIQTGGADESRPVSQSVDGSQREPNDGGTQAGSTTRDEGGRVALRRSLRPGERLDHFVLIELLGEGGFGQVWLASDIRLGREVAIKLPHRRLRPGTLEARRFRREAETAAKLTHPNLVPILEAVIDDDRAYIVSEYCPGPTLNQWLRERSAPVPPRLAVLIVAQLADGISIAHDRGLIHRDIKPSNIILTNAETDLPVPRLADFGLARAKSDTSDTHVGALIGSGPYMSPEQASGNTDEHGPHSDVHALGVLLYEMLTGESPFAAVSELDTIRRIISQDPPSVRRRRPSLSRDVSAICQRCLEKQPSRRYRNAGQLHRDLQLVLDGRPPTARPVGKLGRTWRWTTRNRGLAAMAAAAAISLLVGIVALSALAIQSRRHAAVSEAQSESLRRSLERTQQQREYAVTQQKRAQDNERQAQRTRDRSRRTSYMSDMSLAFLRFHQGQYGEARRLLNRQVPQPGEVDLRSLEWCLLDSEVKSRYGVWGGHTGRGTEVAVIPAGPHGPQGDTVVTAARDGNLIFWDADSGLEKRRLSGLDGRLDALAVLPSGRLIISRPKWPILGPMVITIDPHSGETHSVIHSHSTTVESIRVSANAEVIASGSRYKNIRCYSRENQSSISIANGSRNMGFGLSTDGSFLLTARRDPDALQVWDTRSGALIDQWLVASAGQVAMAHQHPYAAYQIRDSVGFGLVRNDDLSQRRWIETTSHPHVIEFSGDDRYLAVADRRSGVELFELVSSKNAGSDTEAVGPPPEYRSIAYVAGLGGRIESVAFTGSAEFTTVSSDGAVERYAPTRASHRLDVFPQVDSYEMVSVQSPPGALSLQHDGELVYLPIEADQQDGRVSQSVFPSHTSLRSFAITSDRKTIAVSDRDGNLHLLTHWRDQAGELQTPRVRTIAMPLASQSTDLGMSEFSISGRFLAVMSDPAELAVYDMNSDLSAPLLQRSYANNQACIAFAPNEQRLFVCGYAGIEMINLETGVSDFRLPSEDLVRTACFSPQSDRLIVGLENGSITCLDQQTGRAQYTLHSVDITGDHSTRSAEMHFIDDAKLMTMGRDGIAHFWNVDQRVQLGSFAVYSGDANCQECQCVEISHQGNTLIVGLDQGSQTAIYRWTWPTTPLPTLTPAEKKLP
ncbi:WD40 repeat domain-containing serine/threonine protein kinase [Allorhodopirellula solitaria]|uniref:Serine/threonine-protein kinase PrkC n=1 Tax=Allorhodopirellula solitaria TaxID=2527987 RepID=A0A5C5X0X3_9BACT|nr:serine/threonine-protein kinase [Allorhodopirellula solitaria]TWT56259.1 Serine/threonine-protein kinase PrkC [Allorhodopirellula solitaria]